MGQRKMESLSRQSQSQLREGRSTSRVVTAYDHIPVLGDEVVAAFDFGHPALVVDGTLGLGGHSEKLLQRYPDMRVIGLDWDTQALATAQKRLAPFGDRFQGVEASYATLPS